MKVKMLIAELQKHPPEDDVFMEMDDEWLDSVDSVESYDDPSDDEHYGVILR